MADARKIVLITGTSSGAGEALAKEFLSKGFRVLATARNTDSIIHLADLGIETFSLEVHKPASIKSLKLQVDALTNGRLDYLVNNAGRNLTVPALHVDYDEVQYTFETNVFGVMRMCSEFAPLLIAAKGTIVQIGSLAGVMPYVFGSVYNSSKAALHAYSNTLRVELAPFGVHVLTIVTGGIQSNIARTERSLPLDSIYLPIDSDYQRRLKHSQEGASMPAKDYAKSVVNAATRKRVPRFLWEGNKSWLVWLLSTFFPTWFMDWYFTRTFGLWKLHGIHTKTN
ncbi:NAD(P)-binding protein [Pseudovirgaria hyperparasitica]|uniref:NAD(P)-binding protein n=1 Tax=Pseudovirgaria hyperparasitica TaxID=470096 RepID=A0A6A6VQL9_9PEZI|nr:NAD(P)-binding protein [Pseudovirgaria hyperparasitica]KAF2752902.1 NAD(P)-binding protein [Pseudovirgaria hyperparasitica]